MTERSGPTRQPDDTADGQSTPENPAVNATGKPTEKPTVYRGAMALAGGVVVAALGVAGAVDLLVDSGTQDLVGAAVLLLIATMAVAYGIYPAAFTTAELLRIRNPFRTIVVPWPAVTDINARLSFVVQAAERRYTIWAIPVSMHERRKAERSRLRDLSRNDRSTRGRAGRRTQLSDIPIPVSRMEDPITRFSYADQAASEMRDRQEAYALLVGGAAPTVGTAEQPTATSRWTWPMPVTIGCGVVFVVLAAILK
jgi:hypothetical protein